jgi:hypothetical protein
MHPVVNRTVARSAARVTRVYHVHGVLSVLAVHWIQRYCVILRLTE